MAIDPVLLCKDCKFSTLGLANNIMTLGGLVGAKAFMYKCTKTFVPEKELVDPVVGITKEESKMSYCETERKHGLCGPTAKHWVPKHKKDLFKMLTKEENV